MSGLSINSNRARLPFAALPLAFIVLAGTAQAHHPIGGVAPRTLLDGFLSGVGHPVIGPDHLAFTLALGLLAGLMRGATLALPAAFVVASLAGVLAHLAGLDIPLAEPAVAASVAVIGLALAFAGRGLALGLAWIGFAVLAGLLHGYAFGEAVVGSERGAVGAYLAGLTIVQFGLAVIALYAGRWIDARLGARWRMPAGFAVCSLGALLIALAVTPG